MGAYVTWNYPAQAGLISGWWHERAATQRDLRYLSWTKRDTTPPAPSRRQTKVTLPLGVGCLPIRAHLFVPYGIEDAFRPLLIVRVPAAGKGWFGQKAIQQVLFEGAT